MAKKNTEITFEKGLDRLEQIVNSLEQNDLPLEQALELFDEGIGLVKHCYSLLDSAEARVKVLLEDNQEDKDGLTLDTLVITGEG